MVVVVLKESNAAFPRLSLSETGWVEVKQRGKSGSHVVITLIPEIFVQKCVHLTRQVTTVGSCGRD